MPWTKDLGAPCYFDPCVHIGGPPYLNSGWGGSYFVEGHVQDEGWGVGPTHMKCNMGWGGGGDGEGLKFRKICVGK